MTNPEFSDGFTTLVNSYSNVAAFGDQSSKLDFVFDEYEKGLFLTQSQENLVQALYAGEAIGGESYEETERLRRYLASLNREASIEPSTTNAKGIDLNSKFFSLPYDLWFITYEAVKVNSEDSCWNGKYVKVTPVKQDWYHRQIKNPFRGVSKKKALRLDYDGNTIEVVYPLGVDFYYVRYVKRPNPIILENLPSNLSINGDSQYTECELPDHLHQMILKNAVLLALRSKGISLSQGEKE